MDSLSAINTAMRLTHLETMMDIVCKKVDSLNAAPAAATATTLLAAAATVAEPSLGCPFSISNIMSGGAGASSVFGGDSPVGGMLHFVIRFLIYFFMFMLVFELIRSLFFPSSDTDVDGGLSFDEPIQVVYTFASSNIKNKKEEADDAQKKEHQD